MPLPVPAVGEVLGLQGRGGLQQVLGTLQRQFLARFRLRLLVHLEALEDAVLLPLAVLLHQLHPPFHALDPSKELQRRARAHMAGVLRRGEPHVHPCTPRPGQLPAHPFGSHETPRGNADPQHPHLSHHAEALRHRWCRTGATPLRCPACPRPGISLAPSWHCSGCRHRGLPSTPRAPRLEPTLAEGTGGQVQRGWAALGAAGVAPGEFNCSAGRWAPRCPNGTKWPLALQWLLAHPVLRQEGGAETPHASRSYLGVVSRPLVHPP